MVSCAQPELSVVSQPFVTVWASFFAFSGFFRGYAKTCLCIQRQGLQLAPRCRRIRTWTLRLQLRKYVLRVKPCPGRKVNGHFFPPVPFVLSTGVQSPGHGGKGAPAPIKNYIYFCLLQPSGIHECRPQLAVRARWPRDYSMGVRHGRDVYKLLAGRY